MVSLEVHLLLAIRHSAVKFVAGQLLSYFCWPASVLDWELQHADGGAEAAAVGALEYAEHSPQREYAQYLYHTKTDDLQPFLAGIFASTLFWVGARWITTVLPGELTLYVAWAQSNMNRNDTKIVFHEHHLRSVLRTYGLFLLLHHDLRSRLCAQVVEPKCLQGHHRRANGGTTI